MPVSKVRKCSWPLPGVAGLLLEGLQHHIHENQLGERRNVNFLTNIARSCSSTGDTGSDELQEQQEVIALLQEIEASLEQFRMARGRRQLGNRLQDILARHTPPLHFNVTILVVRFIQKYQSISH